MQTRVQVATLAFLVNVLLKLLEPTFLIKVAHSVIAKKRLRSFGPEIDGMVGKYLRGAEQWASANLAWSFDSQRYFGVEHAKVKRTLKVKIKRAADQ